jgi:hypothetical protein
LSFGILLKTAALGFSGLYVIILSRPFNCKHFIFFNIHSYENDRILSYFQTDPKFFRVRVFEVFFFFFFDSVLTVRRVLCRPLKSRIHAFVYFSVPMAGLDLHEYDYDIDAA